MKLSSRSGISCFRVCRTLASGLLLLVAGLLIALLVRHVLRWGSRVSSGLPEHDALAAPDPRQDYQGPFLNVHPEVPYAGDAACDDCHADKARTYRRHPMGRSLTPMRDLLGQFPHDSPGSGFTAFASSFRVQHQDDRIVHVQTRLDEAGQPICALELPVDYVIGSGTRGYSYVSDRDGFLFQTPMSWYSQKRVWDRSPSLGPASLPGRPVVPECLFCHANRVFPLEDSRNAYDRPIFDGFAIGCERCHGPGERHVHERRQGKAPAGGAVDPTIVNPGKLAPTLRDAVCEQCHLAGEPRVLRRGRGLADFRPGMPLELFWSVFVQDRPAKAHHKAVNHVEQMHLSRCFQRSSGAKKLGCVSCHDAHEQPAPQRRVEYYRGRCLECHREHGCSLPREARLKTSKEDSCIVCHMPPYAASDIAHTAATNHRVVRRADPPIGEARPDPITRFPIAFHAGSSQLDEREQKRDLGIALARLAVNGQAPAPRFASRAVDLLEEVLPAFPDDVPAWEAKGQALTLLGRPREARAAFESALARAPRRELSLHGAALLAGAGDDRDRALAFWRRAVDVDPWAPDYRGNLALLLAEARKWDEAREQCQAWLRLDPFSAEGRKLHARCLFSLGDAPAARAELETLDRLRGLR